MKDRIRLFLDKENKTSSQFAEEIGVQPSGVSHVLSGRNKPSLDFVLKMLSTYRDLSSDWLLFGKGEIYRSENEPDLSADLSIDASIDTESKYKEVSLFDDNNIQEEIKESEDNQSKGENMATKLSFSERIILIYPDGTYCEYNRRK